MFTNRHVVVAMLVAPVLAMLAWYGVAQLTGERPRAAQSGQSYPLLEKSNCRYASGACDLENEDFRLTLVYESEAIGPLLVLSSSHALAGVLLGVDDPDTHGQPAVMRAADEQGLKWRLALEAAPRAKQRIRLVARAGGSSYFADAATTFLQPGPEKLQR